MPKIKTCYKVNDFEFDGLQMYEIRLGLEDNLDVSIYAKPNIKSDEMLRIRAELKRKKLDFN